MDLPRPWLAATLALALTGAGCQAGVTGGPADQARSAAESFLDACSQEEVVAAMDILTPDARRTFLRQGSGLDGCVSFLGLAKPGEPLSPRERLDLLRKSTVAGVQDARGEQFVSVTVEGPDGTRHAIDAEQRGSLWELDNAPLAAQTSDPEAQAQESAGSFLDACVKEDAGAASALLATSERASFITDAKAGDASTACLKLLDLEEPGRPLSASEREDLLDRTDVSDVQPLAADASSITLQAPDGRERELDATRSGTEWLLDRPDEDVARATAETLLDACARGDAASVETALAPAVRDRFRAQADTGGVARACLTVLDLEASGPASGLLAGTEVADVHATGPEAYSVTVRAPDGRVRELDAAKRGDAWLLDRPPAG
jgi:hypothetical protein